MQSPTLGGIIPPLVTPLKGRDSLDFPGLEKLVQHVLDGGVRGLFILGTTGEAPCLSYRLRRQMIERVCTLVGGRVPVLVGITDTAMVESLNLARYAADAGADALVLTTPYYFPAGQRELTDSLGRLIPELPLPLMLYNMPALTKVWFEIETLRQLSEFPQVIGVKDSSGDLEYYGKLLELRKTRPDWTFFMGPEHLLVQSVRMGGDGGVNGAANVLPRLFTEAHETAVNHSGRADALQEVIESFQRVYDIGKYASRHIKATKCALSLRGICDDFMTEPFHRFNPPEREKVEAILNEILQHPALAS